MLTTGYTRPKEVFFSLLNSLFVQYSFATANTLHAITLVSSVILVLITSRAQAAAAHKGKGKARAGAAGGPRLVDASAMWAEQAKGMGIVAASFVGAVIGANVVALVMTTLLDRGMSWYKSEYSCALLYGPAALAGTFSSVFPGNAPAFSPIHTASDCRCAHPAGVRAAHARTHAAHVAPPDA
jgi:hypothetical protein